MPDWREKIRERMDGAEPGEIDVPDGWKDLVLRLIATLDGCGLKWHPLDVKRDGGVLRFDFLIDDPCTDRTARRIYHLVHDACAESARTCEVCGKPGILTGFGFGFMALCADHENERRMMVRTRLIPDPEVREGGSAKNPSP